ncbi:IS5 family transposase [Novosphingobium resinovorum]|nr:IS5 family transposase [Novosphingobium resinovorum]EZP81283.1 putative transposase [Novosphingobium resinovorum]
MSTRLMAGLHLLKHMEGLSDEAVCARWVENPYHQFFCGEQHFRHKLPLDRSSMTRWRNRIGADKLELLLAETLRVAMETRAMPPQACEWVTVDTTVQTNAIAHPTDSHLLLRGIEWLNRIARKHGIKLRQSFLRVGRQARRNVSWLINGRGHKQAMRWVRKLRTCLGRLDRDIGCKIAGNEELEAAFAVVRERVAKILTQKAGSTDKLYALHAPEVECIAKGKARTRYEFGVKTSIAVTNARTAGGQFIVGMQALPGNPYDGHTLSGQIEQVERLTGVTVERAYVDRGYKGHQHGGQARVYIAHTRGITSPTIKRELRRQNAIEPIIGHTKSDGLLERNHLAGATGDAINAILVAAGHYLRLLVAWLTAILRALIAAWLSPALPKMAAA